MDKLLSNLKKKYHIFSGTIESTYYLNIYNFIFFLKKNLKCNERSKICKAGDFKDRKDICYMKVLSMLKVLTIV